MPQNPYRRYTDEQLASTDFRILDPLAIDNLRSDKPDPELEPEILGDYDVTPPGGMAANPDADRIWCCHCQAARHWQGFVITNESGGRYLIGSKCGPKYYGATFSGAKNAFLDRSKRKSILERLASICSAADALCSAATEILHSEPLRILDGKRKELKKASPNAFLRLSAAVMNGSVLFETVRVRDLEAERRRDEQSNKKEPGPEIYRDERRSLGMVEGAALLRTRGDYRDLLLEMKEAIASAVSLRDGGTDATSTAAIVKAVRAVEGAVARARAGLDEAGRAGAFFSRGNIGRLERWSAEYTDFSMAAAEPGLRITSRHEGEAVVLPLPEISVPLLPSIGGH